ncbi:MAG: hypothetical protein K0Q73_6795 [Paenibacillus sp.]|jgi:hypothetical protein|nr:hypothetical protein [Paenibacillus sp.]
MKSIKLMLFGVALLLVCIYIQGEPGINFYGNEFFIGLLGFILISIGLFMKTNKD